MSALRTIFGPALLAMGVVAALAYFLSGKNDEYLDEATPPAIATPEPVPPPEPAAAEPPAPVPAPAAPAPAPAALAVPAPAPPPEAPPSEPEVPPQQVDALYPNNPFVSDAAVPPPLPDKLREHAMKMVGPAITMAMEKGDLKQLKQLRGFFEQRKREKLLPPRELEAIDLAIACVEQAPNARDKAHYFLTHGAKSDYAEGLRNACEE
jgi:hypothetical protein